MRKEFIQVRAPGFPWIPGLTAATAPAGFALLSQMQIIHPGARALREAAFRRETQNEQTSVLPALVSDVAVAGTMPRHTQQRALAMRPVARLVPASKNLRYFKGGPRMNLQSIPLTEHFQRFMPPQPDNTSGRDELPVGELTLQRLRTDSEIARIRYLRDEIELPASTLSDPSFHALEKKETRMESSARSNGAVPSSARSDWSPCKEA